MKVNTAKSLKMIKLFLLGAILLFLSACVTQPAKVEKPATDLQILVLGVNALSEPRYPTGAIAHPDEAETNSELMSVAVDLDATNWLQNKDKERIAKFVQDSVQLIAAARMELCSWWNVACKQRRQRSLSSLKQPPATTPAGPEK